MAEAFVHLRASSQYSLLYSAARADELAQAARAQGMSALGITERGGLYGPVSVYQALKSENVAPVLGAVFSVVRERAGGIRREAPVALPVLALGARGFEALCKLSTEAALSSRDSERVITWEELFAHAADLLCLTGDDDGPLGRALREPDRGEGLAARMLGRLREVFADRLYVELCDQGTPTDHERNRILARLAKAQQVPIVATSVIRHLAPDDVRTVDMLHAIGQGLTLAEAVAVRDAHARYHFVSRAEMAQRFRDLPEALARTQEVAERAQIELPVGALHMPRFPLPQGVLESDYLRQVALEGLRLRRPSASRVYAERLAYELQVIEQMGFAGYFLIVWDFMKFAHDQGISTGPGRGSAAGSLVAYALAITDVDPIAYDLLFERFLNAERVSWPDIDIDFEAERRQEVIAYVARRYGDRRVAQIGTLGTFAARAAVRDVGRVLQTPAAQIEALVRTLPAGSSATLSEAIAQAPELQAVLQKAPGLHRVIEAAEAIAGLPRHASIHAAGVVIATEDLTTWTPLMPGTEETFATQYSMEDIEALGLLKMDFLGLRTLTICDRTVAYVKHVRGVEPAYDEAEFDAATKALLASGDTDGCFQLEGTGVKHVLQALCPESLEDVIAVISLYRPGPMEQIGTYIAARRGQVEPKYEPPVLKPILEKTYGILIYQEQIMQIASVMAGFTLGQADVLRRAVAKKKREDLAQARDAFVSGCLKMGHEASVAHEVYDLIVRFADYGFNRSHAAAYAVLAYRTAYLKANYRAEFMAALIADSVSRPDKVAQYALACTRAGILVKAPDVNRSEGDAMPETGVDGALSIRLGLFSVKHVGVGAVARLVEERKQHGPFRSLADLCARVDSRALTKRVLESLIKAGACDGWELSRQTLLKQLDALGKNDRPQTAGERSGGRNSRQLSLLEGTERKASEDVEVRDDAERLQGDDDAEAMRQQDEWERELIGFVVSRQPYAHLQKWREALAVVPLAQIVQGAVSTTGGDRLHHLVADVAGLRTVKTKKGEAMGFLTLEDDSGRMEVVLFPSVYRNLDPLPKVGETLSVHARQDPGGNKSWIATRCFAPEWPVPAQPLIAKRSETKPQKRTLYLKITRALEVDHQQMAVLREILLQRPGEDTVVLFYESGKKRSLDAVRVCADARLVEALTTVIDREAIRVRAQGE